MRHHRLIVLCAALLTAGPLWGGQEEGIAAYNKKDYATAKKEFRPLAEAGDTQAQLLMGLMYDNGLGGQRDYALAFHWYRQAAEQGVARAQFNLGQLYEAGDGVTRDLELALHWFAKAADNGFAEAQYRYGLALSDDKLLPRDEIAAYQWLSLAAAQPVEGAAQAAAARDRLAHGMRAEDIATARQRAEQWLKQHRAKTQGKKIEI